MTLSVQAPNAYQVFAPLSGTIYKADAYAIINGVAQVDFLELINSGCIPLGQGEGIRNNLTAVVDPAATDDTDEDYEVGSVWINVALGRVWRCIISTASAAVWARDGIAGPAGSRAQGAPVALTTTATLLSADVINGLFTANQAGGATATYTMPTGTDLEAALPASFGTGDAFDFSLVNISTVAAEDVAIQGGVDTTLVGSGAVQSNDAITSKSSATFRVRKTGTHAFSFYRI